MHEAEKSAGVLIWQGLALAVRNTPHCPSTCFAYHADRSSGKGFPGKLSPPQEHPRIALVEADCSKRDWEA